MEENKEIQANVAAQPVKGSSRKKTGDLNPKDRQIRISVAQFQMMPIKIWDDLRDHIQFFVDAAVKNQSHFLLLPETFTAQLFSSMPYEWSDQQMIQALCDMSEAYLEVFKEFSAQSKIMIIAGSHPILKSDGCIYNTAHLFTPAGNVYTQDKLHITPKEVRLWNMKPGDTIQLFDTPYGRIGIQICYDIEFPEVARLMTLAGAEVIFVPFSTEDWRGYQRVRCCAQARAIENYVYTAISGNFGSIPVASYERNYAQSAVLSPSDQVFPTDATIIESEADVETVIHAELELLRLASRRKSASVQPIQDRREDLYQLQPLRPVEIVKVL